MNWFLLAACTLFVGCASAPPVPLPMHLLSDHRFAAPSERVQAEDIFALSDSMRTYVDVEMRPLLRQRGLQQGLVDALYNHARLRLEYDASQTRNAAQAFEARAGNCLSLVVMTAAFAKHLGMPVRFQSVLVEESWSREGDLYLASSHVNLSLAKRPVDARVGFDASHLLTIDFLPPEDVIGHRTREVSEATIVAMYMNNRAVESMMQGRLDDAYWWAREAVVRDPAYLRAVNTLAVIYQRRGDPARAEQALHHVLASEPDNLHALSNLVRAQQALGRTDEALKTAARLRQLEPDPPYHFFHLGRAAFAAGDFVRAREHFAREVKRAPYHHEFQFWLAVAHFSLGEFDAADRRMRLAMEHSPTRLQQGRYAEKLERLRSAPRVQ
jgi:Flp pilus assembly protein TadD